MSYKANSLEAIKQELNLCDENSIDNVITKYSTDNRKSVLKLLDQAKKRIEKQKSEKKRVTAMLEFERGLVDGIYCGIDEVGRGPLAGPVVACAVIMPKDGIIPYINDSKQISEKKRDELYDIIQREAIAIGIGMVSPEEIDRINILQATYKAMKKAIADLSMPPEHVIVDAVTIPGITIPQTAIIKGDAKCYSIAASSIIAKVTRDRMMRDYDRLFPGYDFASNKGYGSAEHIEAIRKLGPTPIHRRSFIKAFWNE